MLKHPKRIIVCEKSEERRAFVKQHYPDVLLTTPEECSDFVIKHSDHGGADRVIEVAGGKDTFQLAWQRTEQREQKPNSFGLCRVVRDEAEGNVPDQTP